MALEKRMVFAARGDHRFTNRCSSQSKRKTIKKEERGCNTIKKKRHRVYNSLINFWLIFNFMENRFSFFMWQKLLDSKLSDESLIELWSSDQMIEWRIDIHIYVNIDLLRNQVRMKVASFSCSSARYRRIKLPERKI